MYPVFRSLALVLLLCCSSLTLAGPQVLTSIKPLQLIAAAVQEGVAEPDVLLPVGASPHHYALRPSDMRRLQQAQLFYWIGPQLEGFLAKPLSSRTQPSLALQDLPGLQLRYFAEAQDEHGEEEHDHDHQPGALDVHLWLSPSNAQVIAQRMADDLAAIDPSNAARYQSNLTAFSAQLDQLDQQIKSQLQPLHGKSYFVFHETYDYFEQAYGLHHAGVFNVSAEVAPGARHVAALREQLKQAGPSCVFSEPPLQPRLAQTLSAGLPVKLAELDAMGGALAVNAQGYGQLLQGLANGMTACLSEIAPAH